MNDERRKTKTTYTARSILRPSSCNLQYWALAILIFAYLLLATFYNVVVPLGEGPDEPGHINYVLFLVREERLPVQGVKGVDDVPGEGHQPPLAYVLAASVARWLPVEERQIALTANPLFVWSGGSQPSAFMRGSQELWPWRGVVLAWHLARAVSTVWGAITICCTWALARRLGFGAATALLAAGLVAFNPQFLFTSALMTNDALLAALSAAALLVVFAQVRGAALLLGMLVGLALLTKQSAILLLALIPLAACWRFGRAWWRAVAFGTLSVAVVALVAGWWYWRNTQLYGDLFGLEAFRAEFVTQPWDWRDPAAWAGAFVQLHDSFWGRFGWMSVDAPDWFVFFTALLVALAVAGHVWSFVRNREGLQRRTHMARYGMLALLPLLAWLWIISFALTAGLVAWQGRFLFPASAPIAVLLAAGLHSWRGRATADNSDVPSFFRRASPVVIYVLGGACAVYLAVGVIAPSYPWRVIGEKQALADRGEAVYLRFAENWKRGIELRGWQQVDPWQAGSTVTLTLTWHALEPVSRNWTVFIHLVDAENTVVAEDNTPPQDGQLPMKVWTPGDWLRDPHTLVLPAALEPGTYTLRIGLFDENSRKGRRQGVWDETGEFVGDAADLATIHITK